MQPRSVREIDWHQWVGEMRAAEVLVVREGRILLIRKKRGLGAGKLNGPGGRLEPGERIVDCAVREVEEELCVTPRGLAWMGEHRFQFLDGLSIHLDVFRAEDVVGQPTETDEARPHWFPLDAIPYAEMWADNRLWIPWLLERRRFSGRFVFDGDALLDFELEPCARSGPAPIAG